MNGSIPGAVVAAFGILMSINAIVSGPQAFGGGIVVVIVLMLIGMATTVAGVVELRRGGK
jgi:hypothetical protein